MEDELFCLLEAVTTSGILKALYVFLLLLEVTVPKEDHACQHDLNQPRLITDLPTRKTRRIEDVPLVDITPIGAWNDPDPP